MLLNFISPGMDASAEEKEHTNSEVTFTQLRTLHVPLFLFCMVTRLWGKFIGCDIRKAFS